MKTAGDVMEAALKIKTREEATRFLSDYSQVVVAAHAKEGKYLTAAQALLIARENLSRMAIYYDDGAIEKVMRLFDAPEPASVYVL